MNLRLDTSMAFLFIQFYICKNAAVTNSLIKRNYSRN